MKKKIGIIIICIILLSVSTFSFADVGSFDRYDSGGSSSWGSSSSSSSWGSSSSSSWDYDDDWSFSSGGGSGDSLLGLIILVIIVVASIYSVWKKRKYPYRDRRNIPYNIANTRNTVPNVNTIRTDISQEASNRNAQKVRQIDENFSEERFLGWSKELFIKLQNAWTAREWEPMRPFETETLFEQHAAQIQGYIRSNRINVVDRISISYAYIYSFKQESGKDIIEVALKSVMKDYIIDATTQRLLEGNMYEDRGNLYRLTFERTTGVKTTIEKEEVRTMNCPNCGAPTQITSSGKCAYCGSLITTRDYGWVLANLEPFRNN